MGTGRAIGRDLPGGKPGVLPVARVGRDGCPLVGARLSRDAGQRTGGLSKIGCCAGQFSHALMPKTTLAGQMPSVRSWVCADAALLGRTVPVRITTVHNVLWWLFHIGERGRVASSLTSAPPMNPLQG
jgi:hypothetical protein